MKFFTARKLLLIAAAIEIVLAAFAARWVDRETTFPLYLCFYLAMAVPWLVASHLAFQERAPHPLDAALVLGGAVVLRAIFLPTEPVLSDDIYRYLWDGRVQQAGINPYRYPPEAPELAFLRDGRYAGINNKDLPTIYPPLMQAAFFVVTAVSDSVAAMKGFFVLIDLALVVLLLRLLEARSLHPLRALVYAWSPLPAVEVAGSGHNDVVAVFFLVAALLFFERGRKAASVVLLTASGLLKLLGFALAPLFVPFVRLRLFLLAPLTCLLVAAPYLSAGTLALRGLTEYGLRWRGNDSLFHLLYALSGSLDGAKIVAGAVLVLLAVALAWRKTPPFTACFWTVGAVLLLSPTVHPWYLLWIAPFLAVVASPACLAWMFLTVSVSLSYHAAYLSTPGAAWEELLWVKVLEYGPFFVLSAVSGAAKLVRHDAGPPS